MRIAFCGGGTAGHVYPAIAIAELIEKENRASEFLFIGREGGEENNAIINSGRSLATLDVIGLNGMWSPRSIVAIYKAIRAIGEAKRILREFKPDIIIGTGGYVSFPALVAAQQMKIPTLIHESNAVPGLVTRLLAKRCDAVMLGFEACRSKIPDCRNVRITGNPVRLGFKRYDKREARRRLGLDVSDYVVLSFGGSLGAEALNKAVIECIEEYERRGTIVRHIHATGRRYYDTVLAENPSLKDNRSYKLLSYIDDMPLYLAAADLAITRAGAITTSELLATATPSILIPSPNVSENHQYKNACAIRDLGGALVIPEDELNGTLLADRVIELKSSKEARRSMSMALSAKRDSEKTELITDIIRDFCKQSNSAEV